MGVSWQTTPIHKRGGNKTKDRGDSLNVYPSNSKFKFKNNSKSSANAKNSFNCILTNIRSIGPRTPSGVAKRAELLQICIDHEIDIIFETESWTCESDTNDAVNINGFNIMSRVDQNTESGRGGGIIIYVKNNIQNISFTSSFKGDESFPIQISEICLNLAERNNIKISLVYRSPNQPDNEKEISSIKAIIDTMEKKSNDSVILGDLNLPEVDYEEITTHPYPGVSNKDRSIAYIENLFNLRYVNHVTEPTLIKLIERVQNGEFKHTPIHDVILANSTNLIKNVVVMNGIADSDHGAIKFEISAMKSIPSVEKTYDYRKADWDEVRETFISKYEDGVNPENCPQAILDKLINTIKETEKVSFPLKSRRFSPKHQWDSCKIQKLSKKKLSLFIKYKREGSNSSLADYKSVTKKLKKSVNEARKIHEKRLAMNLKKDSKPFHQYISNHTKYKSKVGPLKVTQDNEETKILDDDTEIANALNDTLGSVFVSDENINELPHTVKLPCNSPLSNIIF